MISLNPPHVAIPTAKSASLWRDSYPCIRCCKRIRLWEHSFWGEELMFWMGMHFMWGGGGWQRSCTAA